jgi:hypothetical protein
LVAELVMNVMRGTIVLSVVAAALMLPRAALPQASRDVGAGPSPAEAPASTDVAATVERLERRSAELARLQQQLFAIIEKHQRGMEELRRRLEAQTGQIEGALRRRAGEAAEGYRSKAMSLDELRTVSIAVVRAGRPGVASRLGRRLRARDLEVTYLARSPVPVRSKTTVYYRTGRRQAALVVARLVPGWQDIFQHTGPTPQADIFIVPGRAR